MNCKSIVSVFVVTVLFVCVVPGTVMEAWSQQVPGAPTGLRATPNQTNKTVALSWTAPRGQRWLRLIIGSTLNANPPLLQNCAYCLSFFAVHRVFPPPKNHKTPGTFPHRDSRL